MQADGLGALCLAQLDLQRVCEANHVASFLRLGEWINVGEGARLLSVLLRPQSLAERRIEAEREMQAVTARGKLAVQLCAWGLNLRPSCVISSPAAMGNVSSRPNDEEVKSTTQDAIESISWPQ